MPLPEQLAAAAVTLEVPLVRYPPRLSSAPINVPPPPPVRIKSARIAGSLKLSKSTNWLPRLSKATIVTLTPPRASPRAPRVEIANLRFRSLPLAKDFGGMPRNLSVASIQPMIPVLSKLPQAQAPRLSDIGKAVAPPPSVPWASIVQLAEFLPNQTLPKLAEEGVVERALDRMAQAKQRDDERRREEQALTERDRRATAAVLHQQMLDQMMLAIWKERHAITRPQQHYILPTNVLERFGISVDTVAAPDVQRQLADIAVQQAEEMSQIIGYVSNRPGRLRREDGGWALDDSAPPELKRMVHAWGANPLNDAAFAGLSKAAPTIPVVEPQVVDPAALWRSARQVRAQAMREWDDRDRSNDTRQAVPGRRPQRPGADRTMRQKPLGHVDRSIHDDRGH